jgi:hypothetical protein
MMYPIRIIKLVSSEVLIAGIAETGGVYTLERPMNVSLVPTVNKNKQPESMVFLKNWIDFSNDEMYIVPKNMVICISNPDSSILRDYNDAKVKFDMLEANEELLDAQEDYENGDFGDEGEELGEGEDEEDDSP